MAAVVPVTAEIAKRAAALAWQDLPDDLVERTRQCLLDWFAVTIAGAQEDLTGILVAEALEDGAKGPPRWSDDVRPCCPRPRR